MVRDNHSRVSNLCELVNLNQEDQDPVQLPRQNLNSAPRTK